MYCDLILNSLSEVARRAFKNMRTFKYEYQSDFARQYFGQGRMEGRLEGRVDLVMRQLAVRFGTLSEEVKSRIAASSLSELDAIGERLLTAKTLQEALG